MKFNTLRNLMLTMLVLGAAGSVVTVGTFGNFTASTSTLGDPFTSGNIAMGNSKSAAVIFNPPTRIIPGDSFGGVLNITNTTGNVDYTYTLTTTSSGTTALFTDTTNGLQMWVQRCTVAWTGTTQTATCGGTTSSILGTALTVGNTVSIKETAVAGFGTLCANGAGSSTAGERTTRATTCTTTGTDFLKVTAIFPVAATQTTFNNLTDTITFTFNATQVTGGAF
jgi:hypothetical protein